MDLASTCPICNRAIGSSGYLVVERTYWYHECADEPHAAPETGVVTHSTTVERAPEPPNPLLQSRLRVLVMPVNDSTTIERLIAGLSAQDAVHSAELEQFDGRSALLGVESTGASDLIAALLRLSDFTIAGLTVTAEGQLNVRLDDTVAPGEAPPLQTAPSPRPAAPAQPPMPTSTDIGAPAAQEDLLASLRASVQRLSGISRAIAEQGDVAPAPPAAEPQSPRWEPVAEAADTPPSSSLFAPALHEADEPSLPAARLPEVERDDASPLRQSSWLFGAPPAPSPVPSSAHSNPAEEAAHETTDERGVFWQEDVFPGANQHEDVVEVDSPAVAHQEPEELVEAGEEPPVAEPLRFTPAAERRSRLFAPEPDEDERFAVAAPISVAPAVQPPAEQTTMTQAPSAVAERETAPHAGLAPDQVLVVASPFQNFAVVNSFITAIRGLPNVHNVAPRRFRDGAIELAIDYSGHDHLGDHIRGLKHFEPEIVSDDGQTVTVQIGGAA